MTNALTLTASSLGRASQPSGAGAVLYVDGDNAVTIDAWPQPSRWIPDRVQLYRGDTEVAAPQPGDDWRWVLQGEHRFGTFRAVARAGEALVESPPMVVQPVPVTVLASAADDVPGPYVRPSRSQGVPVTDGSAATTAGGATPGAVDAASTSAAGSVPRAPLVPAIGMAAGPVPGRAAPSSDRPGRGGPAAEGAVPTAGARGVRQGAAPAPNESTQSLATGPSAATPLAPPSGTSPGRPMPAGIGSGAGSRPTVAGPAARAGPGDSTAKAPSTSPPPGSARVPAHASAQDIAAMVELPRPDYDGRFAAWVATTFVVLAGATLWYAATRLLGEPGMFAATPPSGVPSDPEGPAAFVRPGNLADRIGLGTSTMVMALGVVVILAGAALAALEVRARMLRGDSARGGAAGRGAAGTPSAGPPGTAGTSSSRGLTARGSAGALRHIAVIIDRASSPRAVIAVLVTGGSLVLVGFFGQLHWAMRL